MSLKFAPVWTDIIHFTELNWVPVHLDQFTCLLKTLLQKIVFVSDFVKMSPNMFTLELLNFQAD